MKLFSVANWEQLYETSETKKIMYLKWVPVPNKHDGLGYRRVAANKQRCELFAAWNLILQIASKGRKDTERGRLIRDGVPLSPDDMSLMTGFPSEMFRLALEFFSSRVMNWLIVEDYTVTESPEISAESPDCSGSSPPEEKEGKEGNGTRRGCATPVVQETDEEFMEKLCKSEAYKGIDVRKEYEKMRLWCGQKRLKPSRIRFVNWLNRAEKPMEISRQKQQSFLPGADSL